MDEPSDVDDEPTAPQARPNAWCVVPVEVSVGGVTRTVFKVLFADE